MNSLQAYRKVVLASGILSWLYILNNILGIVLAAISAYCIWFIWHLGLVGLLLFFGSLWTINTVLLPLLFALINQPFIEMAKSGAVRLGVLRVIDEETIRKLADSSVEGWKRVIDETMTAEEFNQKVLRKSS